MRDTHQAIRWVLTIGMIMIHLLFASAALALGFLSLFIQSLGVNLPASVTQLEEALNIVVWMFVLWSTVLIGLSKALNNRWVLVGAAAFLAPPLALMSLLIGWGNTWPWLA